MRWQSWSLITLVSIASMAGCGGQDEAPPKTQQQPPGGNTAPPMNDATAERMSDVTPKAQSTSPAAPATDPSKPAAPAAIELKAMEPPASPTPMPAITILAPKADESVPADKASAYEVKLEVKDWPVAKDATHVHLILDNKPYKAIYEPKASIKLSEIVEGEPTVAEGQHVLVAFPSRETHVSVKPDKGKNPFAVVTFWVGKKGNVTWKKTDPTLIYSRPKGTTSGPMADPLLVDFYLLNTELGEAKNAVRVTVTPASGEAKSMLMTSWAPLGVTGLPNGQAKVRLEFLDKDRKPVPGAFNTVDRTVTIAR